MKISTQIENREVLICPICKENPARENYNRKTCSVECSKIFRKAYQKEYNKKYYQRPEVKKHKREYYQKKKNVTECN